MKSNKQRRLEIKAKRRNRAEALKVNPYTKVIPLPLYAVQAEHSALGHVCSYTPLPLFYVDKPFTCRDCGAKEVWTAKNQKWWYEIIKANIESTATRCTTCRVKRRKAIELQRLHMAEMANKEPHPNEAFFRNN